jgi:hypothetical protein
VKENKMTIKNQWPSLSATRLGLLVAVPTAVLFGAQAIAWAASAVKTFQAGETLTADDLNASFAATVDRTSNQTIDGTKTFVKPIDVGYQVFHAAPAVPGSCVRLPNVPIGVFDCSCPAGTVVVAGGANSNLGTDIVKESRPASATTWRFACTKSSDGSLVDCATMSYACARIGG